MTTLNKAILAIASIGTVGAGIGYGVHSINYENKSALKFKLMSEGFDINVTEEEWTSIETAHASSKNKFTIPDGVSNKKEWLKNKCKEILKKEDALNTSYGKAIQWCVKKEKIVTILKKTNSKFRILNADNSVSGAEKNLWSAKVTALGQQANEKAKTALKVQFSGNEDAKIKEVRDKCKEIIEFETIKEDFADSFKLVKDWCSVSK